MTDRYGKFVETPIGKKVAQNLGLPTPVTLDRFQIGQKIVRGNVLFGSTDGSSSALSDSIAKTLADLQADVYSSSDAAIKSLKNADIDVKSSSDDDKYIALIFDASNIKAIDDLEAMYEFFHPVARSVKASGRVIVLGRPPEDCDTIEYAAAQRSLEGFIKSVAKEFKKGITAQVIYVAEGGENNLDSTLRFFISARSAYVSGQVVRVGSGDVIDAAGAKPFADKTMLVTGASRGIGEAIARVLAREGAHVICLDIPAQQADLQKIAGEIGGSTVTVDITNEDAGKLIAKEAEKRGGLDAIIHNAGVTRDKTLAKMDEKKWNMVIDINLASIARVNDYLFDNDAFNDNARIVCVSSISGIAGNLGQTNYATSKAGVIGLVQSTARMLDDKDSKVTINAVAPGFIETEMTAAIPFAIREAGRRMNSMSQGGLPIDVAETISWLAAPASSGLNGNIVRVCGQSLLGA